MISISELDSDPKHANRDINGEGSVDNQACCVQLVIILSSHVSSLKIPSTCCDRFGLLVVNRLYIRGTPAPVACGAALGVRLAGGRLAGARHLHYFGGRSHWCISVNVCVCTVYVHTCRLYTNCNGVFSCPEAPGLNSLISLYSEVDSRQICPCTPRLSH